MPSYNNSFKFLFTLPGVLGQPGKDLVIEAHKYYDNIELDHVWLGSVDILPVLEYEESKRSGSPLLEELTDAATEHKRELHRQSLTA
jgi:hypothetical protein